MDIIVPAVIGDIVSRALSFAIKKCLQLPDVEKNLERLNQLLLRAHTIAEEAERRRINNRQMLKQLGILIEGMHRGHHMFDNFNCRGLQGEREDEQEKLSGQILLASGCLHLEIGNANPDEQPRFAWLVGHDDCNRVLHDWLITERQFHCSILVLSSWIPDGIHPHGAPYV